MHISYTFKSLQGDQLYEDALTRKKTDISTEHKPSDHHSSFIHYDGKVQFRRDIKCIISLSVSYSFDL